MKYVDVLPIAKTGAGDAVFTYQVNGGPKVGSLVLVPLRNRNVRGMITKIVKRPVSPSQGGPDFKIKEIVKVLSEEPVLTEIQFELAERIADFYFCSLGEVIRTILPFEFGKKRQVVATKQPINQSTEQHLKLTTDQQKIFDVIKKAGANSKHLIFGVTGSGKTEIYLQLAAEAIRQDRTSIVLVPEISLTPQAVTRFEARFPGKIAVWHSRLKETEKYHTWQKIKSGERMVVLGARSAIFTPVSSLKYIFIDEEHDQSYKQDQTPRYETGQIAEWLVGLTRAKLVLGSATPKVETYKKAQEGEYKFYSLNTRIVQEKMPQTKIIDLRDEYRKGNKTVFSDELVDAINEALESQKQVLLFVNRRGASSFVVCRDCGHVESCPNCEIPLVFHPFSSRSDLGASLRSGLNCHHCDFSKASPASCPECSSSAIKFFGLGTQRVEIEAKKLFPDAKICRMDRDTTKKRGSHEEIYEGFKDQSFDILIGTQMITKGWDLPNVAVVGVISADTMLNLPDFRSAERTFALLTQVCGRTGRGFHPGKAIIQTYAPENYAIRAAAHHNYQEFYEREIVEREKYSYPPFSTLVKLTYSSKRAEKAQKEAEELAEALKRDCPFSTKGTVPNEGFLEILGPSPAFIPKLAGKYRYQIVLKIKKRQSVIGNLASFHSQLKPGWTVDVNPESLL